MLSIRKRVHSGLRNRSITEPQVGKLYNRLYLKQDIRLSSSQARTDNNKGKKNENLFSIPDISYDKNLIFNTKEYQRQFIDLNSNSNEFSITLDQNLNKLINEFNLKIDNKNQLLNNILKKLIENYKDNYNHNCYFILQTQTINNLFTVFKNDKLMQYELLNYLINFKIKFTNDYFNKNEINSVLKDLSFGNSNDMIQFLNGGSKLINSNNGGGGEEDYSIYKINKDEIKDLKILKIYEDQFNFRMLSYTINYCIKKNLLLRADQLLKIYEKRLNDKDLLITFNKDLQWDDFIKLSMKYKLQFKIDETNDVENLQLGENESNDNNNNSKFNDFDLIINDLNKYNDKTLFLKSSIPLIDYFSKMHDLSSFLKLTDRIIELNKTRNNERLILFINHYFLKFLIKQKNENVNFKIILSYFLKLFPNSIELILNLGLFGDNYKISNKLNDKEEKLNLFKENFLNNLDDPSIRDELILKDSLPLLSTLTILIKEFLITTKFDINLINDKIINNYIEQVIYIQSLEKGGDNTDKFIEYHPFNSKNHTSQIIDIVIYYCNLDKKYNIGYMILMNFLNRSEEFKTVFTSTKNINQLIYRLSSIDLKKSVELIDKLENDKRLKLSSLIYFNLMIKLFKLGYKDDALKIFKKLINNTTDSKILQNSSKFGKLLINYNYELPSFKNFKKNINKKLQSNITELSNRIIENDESNKSEKADVEEINEMDEINSFEKLLEIELNNYFSKKNYHSIELNDELSKKILFKLFDKNKNLNNKKRKIKEMKLDSIEKTKDNDSTNDKVKINATITE